MCQNSLRIGLMDVKSTLENSLARRFVVDFPLDTHSLAHKSAYKEFTRVLIES